MAGELQMMLFASAAKLSTLSETIKNAKTILEFIAEFPDWRNYSRKLEERKESLHRRMEWLQGVKDDVETQLRNTEVQTGRKRKREVDHWLKSVSKKRDDVNKVTTSLNAVRFLPRFMFRAWLGSCIGEEIQQVKELLEQGMFPAGLLLDAPRDGAELFLTNQLVGLTIQEKIDQICCSINNSNPEDRLIGVQGGEGIGKTAVMMEVYNRLCTSGSYRVYYVNVPQNFTTYSLQSAIAAGMKVDLPEVGENVRAARLFNVLKSMKEYVVILDGLSECFRWEEVGIPAECNNTAAGIMTGKLVFTTRSMDVCRRMVCQETVLLERLSREDSEMLFMEKLLGRSSDLLLLSEEIREIAGGVVQKCNGVPLRIIEMGIQLRGVTDVNEWRSTLNEM